MNLGCLKKYVRNKARPEGSIAERYVANECLTFMSQYIHGCETKFNKKERNHDVSPRDQGPLVLSLQVCHFELNTATEKLSQKFLNVTHKFILNNYEEVGLYQM